MPVLASDFFENLEVWTSVQNAQVGNIGTGLVSSISSVPGQADASGPIPTAISGLGQAGASGPIPSTVSGLGQAGASGPTPYIASKPGSSPASHVQNVAVSTPKAYVSFTISDGDNLQYDQHRMAALWKDSVRGSIPMGWTISPSLVQTAPSLGAYYISTASPNDELTCWTKWRRIYVPVTVASSTVASFSENYRRANAGYEAKYHPGA